MDKFYQCNQYLYEICTKLYPQFEAVSEAISNCLSMKIESNNNWMILIAIFVINVSLYYLCDQMNTLNQIREQPEVEDEEEEVYTELKTAAKPVILPGDETTTTIEVLDKDAYGRIKLIPITLTAKLSSKIVDCKNSLSSLWMNMFINKASDATIDRQLEAMKDDMNANMTSHAPYQDQAARNSEISESFLDLLQRTTAEHCRTYGNSLAGFLHMRIGYMYKDTELLDKMHKEKGQKLETILEEDEV